MFASSTKIVIETSAAKVWDALTNPLLVKQYFFGTTVASDWEKGSRITYTGKWSGKPYEDKGTILEIEPNRLLKTTYFSSMSGQEDAPENYQVITYTLDESNGATTVTITQDNSKDQAGADQAAKNWNMVLKSMKELLER